MKRMTYVDKEGNQVNLSLERKKPLLRFLFVVGNILPIIVIGFLIYTVVINGKCTKIYDKIKEASLSYMKDQSETPTVEGQSTNINISDLYEGQYLKSSDTNDTRCSGIVKITKYKDTFVYTLDVKKCNECSTNQKYKDWTSLQTAYPRNKAIIDVAAYYNYYERQLDTTKWSKYYDEDELSDETSKYGIKLPLDEEDLPKAPKEGSVYNIENDTIYYYRYRDRSWKWYDIEGNYSGFSSERPDGFANKDEDSEIYSPWSEYSTNYPEEKSYRTIDSTTGYKFYYENKQGKKIYYNSGKYTPSEEVNTKKYDKREEETYTLYKYRDKMWRWYNGQKRKYSSYSSRMPSNKPFKDAETEQLGSASSWESERHVTAENQEYRIEEKKLMTRFRIQYEILSMEVLKNPLEIKEFEKKTKMSLLEFNSREDKKLSVSYKFKYRKS